MRRRFLSVPSPPLQFFAYVNRRVTYADFRIHGHLIKIRAARRRRRGNKAIVMHGTSPLCEIWLAPQRIVFVDWFDKRELRTYLRIKLESVCTSSCSLHLHYFLTLSTTSTFLVFNPSSSVSLRLRKWITHSDIELMAGLGFGINSGDENGGGEPILLQFTTGITDKMTRILDMWSRRKKPLCLQCDEASC